MSPKTEHTPCVQDHLPPPQPELKEPSANHQLVPLNKSGPSTINPQPSTNVQLSIIGAQPTGRIRLGKVARLPRQYRDMVCRMLRNNCAARRIVDALGEFGITVTERNISNWKTRGGYAQWCLEEDRAAEIRLHQDHLLQYLRKEQASQIPEVGLQLAASQMSRYLLQPEAIQQLIANPEDYARVVSALCRVTDKIHALQKYRDESTRSLGWKHNPERVRRENEQEIEAVRENYSSTHPLKASDDSIPHRNFTPTAGLSDHPVDHPQQRPPKGELDFLQDVTKAYAQKPKSGGGPSTGATAPPAQA